MTGTAAQITGVPTTPGTYTFTVTATDSLGNTTSSTQAITVAAVPLPPGPAPPKTWHWLITAPQPGGTVLAEIAQARTRTFTMRAGPGTYHEAAVDIDGADPAYAGIAELTTDMQVLLGGTVLFCGRIGAISDTLDAAGHRAVPSALDYKEILRRRDFAHGGGPSFGSQADLSDIAWGLLRPDVIPQDGVHTGVQGYPGGNLGIARGKGQATGQTTIINYGKQKFAGTEIDKLAQMTPGAGFDWDITPYGIADLRLDIWVPARGTDRGVVLAWGDGTVAAIARSTDPSAYANSVYVTSSGFASPSPYIADAADVTASGTGRFDAVIGTDLSTQDALTKAGPWYLQDAETVLPSYQVRLYPGAWDGPSHIWVGDTVTLRVKSGRLQVSDSLPVTEMAFDVDASGIETLTLTAGRVPFRQHQAIPRMLRRIRSLESQ